MKQQNNINGILVQMIADASQSGRNQRISNLDRILHSKKMVIISESFPDPPTDAGMKNIK